MNKALFMTLALVAPIAGTADASEGRIPLLSLPGPPYVITQPGHYVLTRDVSHILGTIVEIQAQGVTLDLGGHALFGSTTPATPVILVTTPYSFWPVVIRNGRLVYGSHGVRNSGERLRIRLEDLDITGSGGGIDLVADVAEIIGCRVHETIGPATAAISVDALTGSILDNLIVNVPGNALLVSGFRAGEIRHNNIYNYGSIVFGASGILLQPSPGDTRRGGAIVADNTVSGLPGGIDDAGITILNDATLVTGNVAVKNGTDGIFVSGVESRLERNVTSINSRDGIRFAAGLQRTHLEANQSQGNLGCGLNINSAGGILFRNNTLGNNAGGNICNGPGINAGGNYCDAALCP